MDVARYRELLGPVYPQAVRVTSAVVLAAVAAADRVRVGTSQTCLEDLTAVVKTFERPVTAQRFVRSLRRVFGGDVIVVDDSATPLSIEDPRVEVIPMPFNSGVSAGRAAGIARVRTPFVLMADDDHVLTHGTRLDRAIDYLRRNPDVDVVAARVIEVPRWYAIQHSGAELYPGTRPPIRAEGEVIDGLTVALKTPQFYVARTEAIRELGWDPQIRMVDHNDFFSRACGRLVVVQDPDLFAFHARTPWRRTYTQHREDVARDLDYLARKWSDPQP